MVKKILLALVILILLGAVLVWYFLNQAVNSPDGGDSNPIVSTVKKAVVNSVSLTCEYTDEQGNQSKTYVKNGAVRSDSTATNPKDSASLIMKDKTLYFWNPSTKQGYKMAVPEEGQTPQGGMPPQALMQAENLVSGLEANKDACTPSMIGDELLTPPSDVTFTEGSQMMQVPTGFDENNMTDEQKQQLQQYMQQYQQQ